MTDEAMVEEFKRLYNSIKGLEEEKRSISEDIKEEKMAVAKKLNMEPKKVNALIKLIKSKEKGEDLTEFDHVAVTVLGQDD